MGWEPILKVILQSHLKEQYLILLKFVESLIITLLKMSTIKNLIIVIVLMLLGMFLLDISFPDCNGIEILKNIKHEKNYPPVLMLSMYSEDQYAIRAIRAGASGYITKDASPEILIDAIKKVAKGRKYISNTLAESIMNHLNDFESSELPHKYLSYREYEIFIKLASGKTVSEIAQELMLSVKTISTYRSRIMNKMKTNFELVQYAFQNNLMQ